MSAQFALIALLLFPSLQPHDGGDGRVKHISGWVLSVRSDRFAGRILCRLGRPKIDYLRQTLVFHLPASSDTSGAIYRVDGGSPIWGQDDQMELVRLGFALHNDDLSNPSGGLVRIPLHRLVNARTVRIEVTPVRPSVKFKIDGLAQALEVARNAGCGPESFQ
jgi:hypothetical protein